jgi:hypothetical protein
MIFDFGFSILDSLRPPQKALWLAGINPKSKIQNPKSKI